MRYLLLLLILIAGTCQADPTGIVTAVRGDVCRGEVKLSQGSEVSEGDTITTTARSFAVIQFSDGGVVTVRPSSQLVIEKYNSDEAELNLIQGGLRIVTGAMAKSNPENYRVNTPVALMGVRGTEFSIYLCGDDVCTSDE